MTLKNGFYEQLINQLIDEKLSKLNSDYYIQKDKIELGLN